MHALCNFKLLLFAFIERQLWVYLIVFFEWSIFLKTYRLVNSTKPQTNTLK